MSELPEKLYYSISEVAEHTGVEPHVLRYWENEFPSLRPKRSRSGSRTYRRKDIDEILLIRKLLHQDGYRIEGARKMLRSERGKQAASEAAKPQLALDFAAMNAEDRLGAVRGELREILDLVREMRSEAGD